MTRRRTVHTHHIAFSTSDAAMVIARSWCFDLLVVWSIASFHLQRPRVNERGIPVILVLDIRQFRVVAESANHYLSMSHVQYEDSTSRFSSKISIAS